jgi:hypothetical protein
MEQSKWDDRPARASAIRFVARKHAGGYRCIEHGDSDFALIPALARGGVRRPLATVTFQPSDQLFREFGRLAPDKAHVQDFANENGLLGTEPARGVYEGDRIFEPGELLTDWIREIERMRAALILWARNKHDEAPLGGLVRHVPDRFVYGGPAFLGDEPGDREISRARDPAEFHRLNDGNGRWLAGAATIFLVRAVNSSLRSSVPVRLREFRSKVRLGFEPESLLAFLWLQFAEAITSDRGFRECEWCGAPIADRRSTCSGRCRAQVHLARVDKAVGLRAKGLSVAAIARQLGVAAAGDRSSAEVVRGWLQKGGRKSPADKRS